MEIESKLSSETQSNDVSQNHIKVDILQIHVQPTNQSFISTPDNTLSFLLRYKSHAISIGLNKEEILIPIDQVVALKITAGKEIAIELMRNFKRSYYRHPNGLSSNTSPISSPQDPTRGKLNNAIYFLFKPMNWVGHNTLMMIEAGMQRLRFDLVKSEGNSLTNNNLRIPQEQPRASLQNTRHVNQIVTEARPLITSQAQSSNIESQAIVNGISLPHEEDNYLELYITCVFPTERRAILFSHQGTFDNFRNIIRQRFGIQSNLFKYKNKANEMIVLRDEEDWLVAKWEVQMEETVRLDVYLG